MTSLFSLHRNRTTIRRVFARVLIALWIASLAAPPAPAAALTPGSWRYTSLGDSMAFGAFAPFAGGYAYEYDDRIEADTGLNVRLAPLGVPGWRSGELLEGLRENWLIRYFVSRSSVVTWNIGGNDLIGARNKYKKKNCGGDDNQACFREAVSAFKANWNAIVAEILSLRSSRDTILRTMDIYNPFVNEDKAADTWPGDQGNDFQVVKRYLEEVNAHIATTAEASGIRSARVYRAFNGPTGELDPSDLGYIFIDGFHANGRGHRKMAELLGDLGYAPLRP
jgi:lysophospholipase L1-like esterase